MTQLSQLAVIESAQATTFPPALTTLQHSARDGLDAHTLPSRKTEHWKYSFKRLKGSETLNLAEASWKAITRQIQIPDAIDIDLLNGSVEMPVAAIEKVEGLRIKHFAELDEEEANLISSHSNNHEHGEFEQLNRAIFKDALFIVVSKGAVITQPVVLHQHHAGNGMSASRVFVLLNESASATVIESFDVQAEEAMSISQTDCIVSDNARLTYLRMNLDTTAHKLVGTTRFVLKRDANLETHNLCLGSALGRHDLHVVMDGAGANCDLNGVVVTRNNEHFDNHTVIDHVAPHCTSEENYRCIADDSSHIVFNGRIHIHRDAQKTLGSMNNKNLLLSSKAAIDTKPELEIYADDVKCAHGATIGQLNEKEVYYLKTRGLSDQQARQMLTLGFVLEIVRAAPIETVAEAWEHRLSSMLSFQG